MINNGPPLDKPTARVDEIPTHEQLNENAIPNRDSQVNFFSKETSMLFDIGDI